MPGANESKQMNQNNRRKEVPMSFTLKSIYLVGFLSILSPLRAATRTVDLSGGADYTDIQSAIDAAAGGDTVLVKPGEYVIEAPITFGGKAITVKSEAGAEVTTIRMSETPADAERASVVIFESLETDESVLRGFTLTGGTGTLYTGAGADLMFGGGVFFHSPCTPRIVDCAIVGNSAQVGGGVSCVDGASPSIDTSQIVRNLAVGDDGCAAGLCAGLNGSAPVLRSCTVAENVAPSPGSFGGGFFFLHASPTVIGCSISRNFAGTGGGVLCSTGSDAEIVDCTIEANATFQGWGAGGGVCCWYPDSLRMADCRILGNYASGGNGAGVHCGGNGDDPTFRSNLELTNCIIAGNRSPDGDAGGLHCWRADPRLYNCTITANSSPINGALSCTEAVPVLMNCIVWGNSPESVCGTLSCCLTDLDPLFVHGGAFDFTRFVTVEIWGVEYSLPDFIIEPPDYRLHPDSPAIDAGTCEGAPETDIEGNPRPLGAGCDIGAYEYADDLPEVQFIRGEVNGEGRVDLSDAVTILGYLFLGSAEPSCLKSADTDDSGDLNLTDAVFLLGHLFLGGPQPPTPYPACGEDTTDDALTCLRFTACE
ncbi:MAG: right-handed parallel beta-helix repeat-containing protein [Planctomycetes bacterium]|nr:right-handed parallel beta-helix repeat-containing protein [Planctomycetota bacterium]